jgi:CRISPR-associated endonuclease/helicase Cas3
MTQLLDMREILNSHINDCSRIWAHTKAEKPSETLLEHSQLCMNYFNEYCKIKGVDRIVQRTIRACGCTEEEVKAIYSLFVHAIYFHDIGKMNPFYQCRRLKNPYYQDDRWKYDGSTNHALPSAYIYMCECMPLIEGNSKRKLSYYLFYFAQ